MGFSYNVNVLNQKGSPALYTDTFANRPAAGYAGRLFVSSDTSAIYEDTGTAWVLIANVSSGAGTLEQVTTNGNTTTQGISISAGGLSTNSLTDTALTAGSVPFVGTGGLITQSNANLFYDNTNKRLGINTVTPSNPLDIHSGSSNAFIGLNNTAGNQAIIIFSNTGVNKWSIGNSITNSFDIYNTSLLLNAISISLATNCVSFIKNILLKQDGGLASVAGYNGIGVDSNGFFFQIGTSANTAYFNLSGLSAARSYTLPNAAGTLALTSDLSSYLPLAGGTLTGALNGTTARFTSRLNVNGATDDGTTALNVTGAAKISTTITAVGQIVSQSGNNTQAFYAASATTGWISYYLGNTGANFEIAIDTSTGGSKFTGGAAYGSGLIINGNHQFYIQNNGTIYQTIASNGVVTFQNLAGTGSRAVLVDASGNLSAPVSDQTVKENVQPLQYGLNTIMQLNPISFEYIDEYKNYGEGLQIGNIAQDVANVIPEAVFLTPSTGLMGINYNQFDGIYIKAIQELNIIIENQNTLIQSLITRIELLENK